MTATGERCGATTARVPRLFSTRECLAALCVWLLSAGCLQAATLPPVLINEILYHPDPDNTGDEYVELHNPGDIELDLSGWILDGGIDFLFPTGTKLAKKGYLIVARDAAAARAFYHATNVLGNFAGRLNNIGDTIRLKNN